MSSFSTFLRVERNYNYDIATNLSWLFLMTKVTLHFIYLRNVTYLKLHEFFTFLINDIKKNAKKRAT